MQTAYLGLGSNLGDRRAYLDAAVEGLRATPGIRVLAVSRFHESSPVGGPPGQDAYLNGVVEIGTSLSPEDLLDVCHSLETKAGRVRAERWGPRTLDVDILLYGDQVIDTPTLTIPHPRLHERKFVLDPLCELSDEDLFHPLLKKTIWQIRDEGWWRRDLGVS